MPTRECISSSNDGSGVASFSLEANIWGFRIDFRRARRGLSNLRQMGLRCDDPVM